jgi:hypothetical protein
VTRRVTTARAAGAGFAAGAVAVLAAHQAVLLALHARGWAPWPAYSLAPTRPFGVPAVLSAAFWGGAWGVPLALVVRGARSPGAACARGALFGAVAPNVVGAALLALGRVPAPPAGGAAAALASAVVVNACWGLAATALLARRLGTRQPAS